MEQPAKNIAIHRVLKIAPGDLTTSTFADFVRDLVAMSYSPLAAPLDAPNFGEIQENVDAAYEAFRTQNYGAFAHRCKHWRPGRCFFRLRFLVTEMYLYKQIS
jgi:hypothetical protein